MALTKSFEKYGTTFESAYHRITNLNYNVHEYKEMVYVDQEPDEDGNPLPANMEEQWVTMRQARFTLVTYVDSAARENHKEPVAQAEYSFTPDWESEDNILAQAYSYIKTLDAYAEAVDA